MLETSAAVAPEDDLVQSLFEDLPEPLRAIANEFSSDTLQRLFATPQDLSQSQFEAIAKQEEVAPELLRQLLELRPQLEQSLELETESDTNLLGGAHADYDNEIKQAWRSAWQSFLDRNLPLKNRENLKVLCLPSKDPKREVQLYTQIGISPENIIGVEGDPRVRAEFEQNAAQLGIRTIFGRLENIVPRLKEKIDIVSLDFLGPMCPAYVNIIRKFPVAEKYYLLVNVRGAREQSKIQTSIASAHSEMVTHDQIRRAKAVREHVESLEHIFDVTLPPIEFDTINSSEMNEEDFPTLREKIFDNLIIANFGVERAPKHPAYQIIVEEALKYTRARGYESFDQEAAFKFSLEIFKRFHERIFVGLDSALQSVSSDWSASRGNLPALIDVFFHNSLTMESYYSDMQRIKYFSETSKSHAPYLSTFAAGIAPHRDYQKWGAAAIFLAKVFNLRTHSHDGREPDEIGEFGFAFRGSNSKTWPKKITGQLDLCFFEGKKVHARVPAQAFLSALNEFVHYIENFNFEERWISSIPRTILRPRSSKE